MIKQSVKNEHINQLEQLPMKSYTQTNIFSYKLALLLFLYGYATIGILHPGMESKPESGHGKTGESAKKSHKNDSGLQGFELQGNVESMWTNNTGEKEAQRTLNRSL